MLFGSSSLDTMQTITPAFNVLKRFYQDPQQNLKLLLSRELDKVKDFHLHAAITRTVYEVVRNHEVLEHILEPFCQRKLTKIQTEVLLVLKIGTHLLLFSEAYPDYAVVNEVVNTARGRAKTFVNAILRKIAANKAAVRSNLETIPQPGMLFSLSGILLDNLKRLSTSPEKDALYLNREPRFHIRVNTAAFSYAAAKELLLEHRIPFEELTPFYSFTIKESGQVIRLNRSRAGSPFYFQNTGSQVVSIIASRLARRQVLDCCAAPGTKSVTLSLLNPGLSIFANDINPKRAALLNDFLGQYRLTRIKPVAADIKNSGLRDNFDFIIVDAPCTSSGTLRKNPDLKLKINSALVEKNAQNQYEIMAAVMAAFPGCAYILYAVCSFIHAESEGVMETLFKTPALAGNFEPVDLTAVLEEYGFAYKKSNHGHFLLPGDELNNDLFYLSLLKNKPV
jgi:16S rRNA (cytosine967-C5)-methyltransferase